MASLFDFFCGDEVYGNCTGLRTFFEARNQAYVLRVPSNFRLTAGQQQEVNLPADRRQPRRSPASIPRSAPRGKFQRRPLVCVVVAGDRLAGALPADPPPPQVPVSWPFTTVTSPAASR